MATADAPAPKGFTGRHMAAVLVTFFGVVIAVNFTMAKLASGTFGGVVVENSYVASQHYNRWLEQAEKQRALGWKVTPARQGSKVALTLAGVPAGAVVTAVARHPLGTRPDHPLTFAPAGEGRLVSLQSLPVDRWELRLDVRAGGHRWRSEAPLS